VPEAFVHQLFKRLFRLPALHDDAVGGADNAGAVGPVPAVHQNGLGRSADDQQAVHEFFPGHFPCRQFNAVQAQSGMFRLIGVAVVFPQVQDGFEPQLFQGLEPVAAGLSGTVQLRAEAVAVSGVFYLDGSGGVHQDFCAGKGKRRRQNGEYHSVPVHGFFQESDG